MNLAFASFAELHDLPEPALRELLVTGKARERVWAAWALALRIGTRSLDALKPVARGDPDAGARRHLAVLLAGFGEHAALGALASSDPDVDVRATATRYLVRLAPAHSALWRSVREQLHSHDALVRETVVAELGASAPDDVKSAAAELLRDPDRSVRAAVLANAAILEAWLSPAVKAQAFVERDAELRHELFARWAASEGPDSLLEAAARAANEELAFDALGIVGGSSVSWAAVAPLTAIGSPKLQLRLFDLFAGRLEEVAVDWALQVLAHLHEFPLGSVVELAARLRSQQALSDASCAALRVLTERAREKLRDPYWSESDWAEWEADLRALEIEACRLCSGSAEE